MRGDTNVTEGKTPLNPNIFPGSHTGNVVGDQASQHESSHRLSGVTPGKHVLVPQFPQPDGAGEVPTSTPEVTVGRVMVVMGVSQASIPWGGCPAFLTTASPQELSQHFLHVWGGDTAKEPPNAQGKGQPHPSPPHTHTCGAISSNAPTHPSSPEPKAGAGGNTPQVSYSRRKQSSWKSWDRGSPTPQS